MPFWSCSILPCDSVRYADTTPNGQVSNVLGATDESGRSLMASAAQGGSLAVVREVASIIGGEVGQRSSA